MLRIITGTIRNRPVTGQRDTVMTKNPHKRLGSTLYPSPWIIVGSAVILLGAVVALAVQNYNREEKYMASILSEKGAAIIKAVEAGARTGIIGLMWDGRQIQTLIEETALVPGVLHITVTDRNGHVLASSQKELIGAQVNIHNGKTGLPLETIQWSMINTVGNRRSFEVFQYFKPVSRQDNRLHAAMHAMMRSGVANKGSPDDWCFPSKDPDDDKVILVGLDPGPFENARKEDIRTTVVISGVLVILGLAGFISMFWLQSFRMAKQSLQDTSAVAAEIVTSLPVGLIATDRDGKIAFFNSAAQRITGLDAGAARGKTLDEILPDAFSSLSGVKDRNQTISEKEMECGFTRNRTVPVSVSTSSIINEEGQFVGRVLILRDLGEVRRLQDEISRNEKLAAIGGLAAGVAHEIRNPLSSIKGIATYFKSRFDENGSDAEMADVMIEEVNRLNRVISELLEFAKPTDLTLKQSDVNTLVTYSIQLIEKEAQRKHIRIEADLPQDPLMLEMDSDRLTQCLLNLYLNSLQAMDQGGTLTVSVLAAQSDRVEITVRDTGPGISPEHMNKIFDPYFTTKPKGTGLGLAIVNKIVEAHSGTIKVRSVPGKGTAFSIIIPAKRS